MSINWCDRICTLCLCRIVMQDQLQTNNNSIYGQQNHAVCLMKFYIFLFILSRK